MGNHRAALAVAMVLFLGAFASPSRADPGFVVVCHTSNPVTTLSNADLKKALTGGTKQWESGAVVQIGITSTETPELTFLAGAAGLTAAELLTRIQQQVFKGEMRRPVILRSPAECLGLVRMSPTHSCPGIYPGGMGSWAARDSPSSFPDTS